MRSGRPQTRQIAQCQQLESRKFLAASFAEVSSRGTLLINGTDDTNQITIGVASGAGAGQIIVTRDGSMLQFPLDAVRRLYIDAGAGDDSVTVSAKVSATILGREGNDRLIGGPLADSIDGGTGDDTINGEGGLDILTGGDGTDSADWSDRDEPFRIAESGDKDASEGYTAGTLVAGPVEHRDGQDPIEDRSTDLFEIMIATRFNDVLSGWPRAETTTCTMQGGGGDDTFEFSYGGAYFFDGGPGRDSFAGGGYAATTFSGGPGNDYFLTNRYWTSIIDGGPGRDTLDNVNSAPILDLNLFNSVENVVNAAGQLVIGTDAANYIFATDSGASITVRGNGGNDTIIGSQFADYLCGGDGNDSIDGGGGNDTILGGIGNDILIGNAGNDKLYGGAGNDTLVGGRGRDRMYGEAGDDLFAARDKKRDTLYGGDGTDSATVENKGKIQDLYHEIEKLV